MIRLLDIVLSGLGLLIIWPILVLITFLVWLDTGSPVFLQERVGRLQKPFTLIKFRSMRIGTASIATHLVSKDSITPFGHFLRQTKLDELPQLLNVIKGEMSLVGPRPCLFSQGELIQARLERNVFLSRPGITGLAQINKIDMSTPEILAETDAKMLKTLTVSNYFRYILRTVIGRGLRNEI